MSRFLYLKNILEPKKLTFKSTFLTSFIAEQNSLFFSYTKFNYQRFELFQTFIFLDLKDKKEWL